MPSDDGAIAAVPLQIRALRPSDIVSICNILRDSAEAAHWPSESYAQLAASPSGLLLVCETNAQIVGFVAARQIADQAEILNIAVDRNFRRKGVATALLLAAMNKFRGSTIVTIFLELRESNHPARALYERNGFVASASRKFYYRDPAEDALCMNKNLTAATD